MADIIGALLENEKFSRLIEAVKISGLVITLTTSGPLTFFAPTDEAFDKLSRAELNLILRDPRRLKAVMNYHLVDGAFRSQDLAMVDYLQSVSGGEIKIDSSFWQLMKRLKVNDAIIVKPDIIAANGVCHGIDKVMMPKIVVAGEQII